MAQIHIKFVTQQEEYAIPDTPYVVAGNATSKELNSLLKTVLKSTKSEEECDVDFDFLCAKELLRSTLQEHIEQNNISTEENVQIEYFVKCPAPTPEKSVCHDDWVSAVKISGEWILSGCYDATLHIWGLDGSHKIVIPGHLSAIKAVEWISSNDNMSSFISTSHDETAILWLWDQQSNSVECVHVCKGHCRSVDCVDVNLSEHKFVTGSYDGTLKIWSTDVTLDSEKTPGSENDRKRFKSIDGRTKVKTPLLTLNGHTEGIKGLQWTENNEICTVSLDSTIRVWDVELGGLKHQLNGSKAFMALSYSPLSKRIITASADRHVRLWDHRSRDGTLVKNVFTSHNNWVMAVKWSPTDEYQFISGAYDNVVKLWDTRSAKTPLFDLTGHEDKVFALDWSEDNYIATGAADHYVKLYKLQDRRITTHEMG